jgi:hypothetical protein
MTTSHYIPLDADTADRITITNLKEAYDNLERDINDMQNQLTEGTLPEYRNEDLLYNIKMLKHIEQVLSYFGEKI